MNIYKNPVSESINGLKLIYALTSEGVDKVANKATAPDPASLIYGDYTKWCSNLLYYPIDFTKYENAHGNLFLGRTAPIQTDIPVIEMMSENGYLNGYDVGEIYYNYQREENNRFAEYEPYTSVQLYLPYYGHASLKVADILGKYIQIKLDIDHATGQAMYTVMVSDKHIERIPDWFFWVYDTAYYGEIRILSTYVFQLGTPVPFTSSGMVDAVRNTLSTVVKTGAMIAGYAIGGVEGGVATSVVTREFTRNPTTGRLNVTGKTEKVTTTESGGSVKQRGTEGAFEASAAALNNLAMNPTTDKPNNSLLGLTSERRAVLIIKQAIIDESASAKLYGKPYGHTDRLKWVSGYTEVSRIHLEGMPTITDDEAARLEQAIAEGVILPDVSFLYFTINGESVRFVSGMTWNDFVRSAYNIGNAFTISDDTIFYLGNTVKLDGAVVTRNDTVQVASYTSAVG